MSSSATTATNTPYLFASLMDHVMTEREQVGYHHKEQRFVLIRKPASSRDLEGIATDCDTIAEKMNSLTRRFIWDIPENDPDPSELRITYEMDLKSAIYLQRNIDVLNGEKEKEYSQNEYFEAISLKRKVIIRDQREVPKLLQFLSQCLGDLHLIDCHPISEFFSGCDASLLAADDKRLLIKHISRLFLRWNAFGGALPLPAKGLKSLTHFLANNEFDFAFLKDLRSLRLYVQSSFIDLTFTDLDSLNRIKTYPTLFSYCTGEEITSVQNLIDKRYEELKLLLSAINILPSDLLNIIAAYDSRSEFLAGVIKANFATFLYQDPTRTDPAREKSYTILNTFSQHSTLTVAPIMRELFETGNSTPMALISVLSRSQEIWLKQPHFVQKAVTLISSLPFSSSEHTSGKWKEQLQQIKVLLNKK